MTSDENQLKQVMDDLRSLDVDPISVWADGPNNNLRVWVMVKSMADWDTVAALNRGWRLSLGRDTGDAA